jgi:peptidoglycan hydrolase-like protein with peptidoglycan-binding domain
MNNIKNFKEYFLTENVKPEIIKQAQTVLKKLGYKLGSSGENKDGVDGVMGNITTSALKDYQTKYIVTKNPSYKAEGKLDTTTISYLLRKENTPNKSTDKSINFVIDKSYGLPIKQVQEFLVNNKFLVPTYKSTKRNMNVNSIDGIYGIRTKEALKKYQNSIKIPQTGELDALTIKNIEEKIGKNITPIKLNKEENFTQQINNEREYMKRKSFGYNWLLISEKNGLGMIFDNNSNLLFKAPVISGTSIGDVGKQPTYTEWLNMPENKNISKERELALKNNDVNKKNEIHDNFCKWVIKKQLAVSPSGIYTIFDKSISSNKGEKTNYGNYRYKLNNDSTDEKNIDMALHSTNNPERNKILKKAQEELKKNGKISDDVSKKLRMSTMCLNFEQSDLDKMSKYIGANSKIVVLPEDGKSLVMKNDDFGKSIHNIEKDSTGSGLDMNNVFTKLLAQL